MTSLPARLHSSQALAESDHQRARAAAAIVVYVLIGEQALTAIVGIWGGLRISDAALLLHAQIVGQLLLDASAFALLLRSCGWRPGWPRALVGGLAALVLAAVIKNIGVSPSSAAIDLVRLVVPVIWVALIPLPGFAEAFFDLVGRYRNVIVVVLVAQVFGLAVGRLIGWEKAYLSGDPITQLLIFPAAIVGSGAIGQILTILLSVILLVGSLKRTSWVSAIVVIALLAAVSLRWVSRATLIRVCIVALLAIVMMAAFVQVVGLSGRLMVRAQSVENSLTRPDNSIDQRLDEVRVEGARAVRQPVEAVLIGVSSENMRLSNGQLTHAIHNTPVFLILGGGLVWLFALVAAGRRGSRGSTRQELLIALVVIGTLLDSLGENLAIAPSFGLALAIGQGQVRRLLARNSTGV